MDSLLNLLNNSKFLVGVAILMSNVGGRYMSLDLTKKEEKILQTPIVRRTLVFFVAFIATRDIIVSVIITLLFIIVVKRNKIFNSSLDEDDDEDEN
jgi:hypothetical protein